MDPICENGIFRIGLLQLLGSNINDKEQTLSRPLSNVLLLDISNDAI